CFNKGYQHFTVFTLLIISCHSLCGAFPYKARVKLPKLVSNFTFYSTSRSFWEGRDMLERCSPMGGSFSSPPPLPPGRDVKLYSVPIPTLTLTLEIIVMYSLESDCLQVK